MANITKTTGVSILAWQQVANQASATGTITGLPTTSLGLGLTIHLARQSGSAFTAGWPNVRVEVSSKSSGDDAWAPVATYQPAAGAALVNTTLSSAVSASATTVPVASATNIAAGDILFLGDSSSSNWELDRVKSVSGTTITLEEACTYNHSSGAAVYDQSEIYCCTVDLLGFTRARVVVDNGNGGQTVAVRVLGVYAESIG